MKPFFKDPQRFSISGRVSSAIKIPTSIFLIIREASLLAVFSPPSGLSVQTPPRVKARVAYLENEE